MLADTLIDSDQPIPQPAISAPAGRTAPMQESHRADRPARQRSRSSNSSTIVTDSTPVARAETPVTLRESRPVSTLDALYQEQLKVAAPHYTTAEDLARLYPEDKFASRDLSASLGRSVQEGDSVTVSYSVLNRSGRWIEVLRLCWNSTTQPSPRRMERWIRSTGGLGRAVAHQRLPDEQDEAGAG